MTRRHLLAPVVLTAALTLGAVGCGGSSDSASSDASTTTAASSSAAGASTTAGPGTTTKVSANDASKAEITSALDAAGVPNAARWANEIEEYRPYPADDPSFTELRAELEKYNPGAGTIDQIVAVLQP